MNGPQALGYLEVAVATSLVFLTGGVSLALKLGLERRLLWAACRTVTQLLLIGYALKFIFGLNHPAAVLLICLVMVAVAAHAAIGRSEKTFAGLYGLSFLALVASSLITTAIVTQGVIRIDPWFKPQYVIPLLGMILGNALTGISLCLDYLLQELKDRRAEVEMELAHGATSWEAARRPLSDAVRRGMIPILNSMIVVGIVSLPGMMTGQILSGTDPLQAVRYQIVVMFMVAAAAAMGSMFVALLVYRRLFNKRHQLCWQVISDRPK